MTYNDTINYIVSKVPMYHHIGAAAYKANLDNIHSMMEYLGHPENKFHSIHVAGTNGKGSVSHLTASMLQHAGYKVGLYTSPHLIDFRERIRIGGDMISREEVVRFVEQHQHYIDTHELSFFELTVGMAFDHFVRHQIEVAVVEVGLGGRLDATNVITPDISVITNIGLEHTQFLGDTLPKIAFEKAGIIKPFRTVVIGETHAETEPVFRQRAQEENAPIVFADQHFRIEETQSDAEQILFNVWREDEKIYSDLTCPLAGSYQLKNLATFFQVAEMMYLDGYGDIDEHAVIEGVRDVVISTGLHGRWEAIAHNPLTICETAHNADGIGAMLKKIDTLKYNHLHIIYGCVNDKDYRLIFSMLPRQAQYYFTQPSVERALPVADLVKAANEEGIGGPSFADVHQAIAHVREIAQPNDLILVTGSIFLVADALNTQQHSII